MSWFAKLNPFGHRCKQRPVDVQHREMPVLSPLGGSAAPPPMVSVTIVLYSCSCGMAHTHQLAGTWSLEQIMGKSVSGAVDAVIETALRPASALKP